MHDHEAAAGGGPAGALEPHGERAVRERAGLHGRAVTDVAAISDRGRVREDNQDRCVTRRARGGPLVAVADGVGGEAGGDVASSAAVEALAGTFDFGTADVATALAAALRAANDAVLRAAEERSRPGAASTVVAAAGRGPPPAPPRPGGSRGPPPRRRGASGRPARREPSSPSRTSAAARTT